MLPQDASFPEPAKSSRPTQLRGNGVAGRLDPASRGPRNEVQAAMLPTALSSAPDMNSYFQALKRRWVTAAAIGGTLAVVAAMAAWF